MLDSGMANRINWSAEKLPHEVGFKLGMQWTPTTISSLRPGIPGSAPTALLNDRKRANFSPEKPKFTPMNFENDILKKFENEPSNKVSISGGKNECHFYANFGKN